MNYAMLVNKENKLLESFIPNDLVNIKSKKGKYIDNSYKNCLNKRAYRAFREMRSAAKKFGYNIVVDSGYRSYDYQIKVLNYWLNKDGEDAYNFVALPGTSEHQTGLAIDIGLIINKEHVAQFDDSFHEVKWLQQNSYKYGFILRYPKDKEEITGYSYEPWHFRYVGKVLSKKLYKLEYTLEEYYKH
ncbi:MAG: M15 family metallopeptidase [Bacilli bacterium]|nr:M15 family metallopeptidase [Bacilli bacterium]